MFDGPSILLKLHVDRFNTLRDIAIITRATLASSVLAMERWLADRLAGWLSHAGIVSKRLNIS